MQIEELLLDAVGVAASLVQRSRRTSTPSQASRKICVLRLKRADTDGPVVQAV